jgi:hypothetical protein
MHLNPNSVACAMRTKHNRVQGRRARSARYAECTNVVCFDLACAVLLVGFSYLSLTAG